jgi:archaellum component FlaF (FlaF/FlaG flagellin family)
MDWVVAPVDQRFPVADDEVNVTEPPGQNELPPLMVGVAAAGLADTTKGAELAEQPPALVAVTAKVPAADTVIDCVVAPVDQTFPVADEDVSVMLEPGQNAEGPVMVGVVCAGLAVTTNAADAAEQPPASVTVTL